MTRIPVELQQSPWQNRVRFMEAVFTNRMNPRFLSSTLLHFYFGVSFSKQNRRKKGALIIKGLLRNLVSFREQKPASPIGL